MSLAQQTATRLAQKFNQEIEKRTIDDKTQEIPTITILPCVIFRLRDENSSGGFRYLSAEKYLEGTFRKFNSNNGFVDSKMDIQNLVAQAFSHFTYEYTKKNLEEQKVNFLSPLQHKSNRMDNTILLVCDIQGVDFVYTDTSVCTSTGGLYGKSDFGIKGFKNFFCHHKCNSICTFLNLSIVDANIFV